MECIWMMMMMVTIEGGAGEDDGRIMTIRQK